MPVTLPQREARALFNLARNPSMSRNQLYCASVTNAVIDGLANDGHVTTERNAVAITGAGLAELDARIHAGTASTITHRHLT